MKTCKKCGKKISITSFVYGSGLCRSCSCKECSRPITKGSKLGYTIEFSDELKEEIRERDNHECQLCHKSEEQEIQELSRKLCIHHIDYNKKNCNEDNLISLCNSCHVKTNLNRDYWSVYFIKIINNLLQNIGIL